MEYLNKNDYIYQSFLFTNEINYADRYMGRDKYIETGRYIITMSDIEGGKKPAKELLNYLLETYRKRSAMVQELKKMKID
jgi:hypothetical protein